ncbi:hypothetical protein MJO28_015949, partial [Puccinia striiformis f. sp. tritici]
MPCPQRFLHGANLSIHKTISNMHDALKHQLHKLMINSATQKTVHINALPAVLSRLSGTISHCALRACQCAYSAGRSAECKDCTCELHWGMPCSHQMRQLELEKEFLKPEDFHTRWHLPDVSERFQNLPANTKGSFIIKFGRLLDQTDVLAPLEDPLKQQHKGNLAMERRIRKREYRVKPKKKPVGRPRKVVPKEEKEAPKSSPGLSDSDQELPDITLKPSSAETSEQPAKRAQRVQQVQSATEVVAPPQDIVTRSGHVIKRTIDMKETEEEESSSDTHES